MKDQFKENKIIFQMIFHKKIMQKINNFKKFKVSPNLNYQ